MREVAPPTGAVWSHPRKFRRIPRPLLWVLSKFYQHFLSDIWQSGYRQGARDARRADHMAEVEKGPALVELVTRTNQHVHVKVRRDENAVIGTPWTPFN